MNVGAIERLAILVLTLAFGPQIACGSSNPPPAGPGGAGGNGGAAGAGGAADAGKLDVTCNPDASLGVASPTCNALTNDAPSVPFTADPGSPPSFAGGSIQDGLYYATRADGYAEAGASGRKLTLAITGGGTQFFWNGDVLDGTAQDIEESFAANATVLASGSTLALTVTCASISPAPIPASMSYTASDTILVLAAVTSGSSTSATTYTRQGCPPSSGPPDAL